MSLRERVKEWIAKARVQLRDLAHRRHELPVGSKERKEAAKAVRAKRRELEKLKKQLARIDHRHDENKKADWQGLTPVLGTLGEQVVIKAAEFGLIPTSTTGGSHSPTSWHPRGHAIDFGVIGPLVGSAEARTREIAFQRWLDDEFGGSAYEIFGPDSHYYKNGVRYGGMFPDHGDHDHFAHP